MQYLPLPIDLNTDNRSASSWRPWCLRLPFLVSFPIVCAVLIACIELIVLGCTGGCHVFGAPSAVKLSWGTNFVYNQLPTAAALALSMLWALPNYNVMRLEPYFQMSTPDGATAANSILLHYPYLFASFVPLQAAKQRHYVVLLSSSVAFTINFIITPLISGMFNEGTISTDIPGFAIRKRLREWTENLYPISTGFAFLTYNYAWLNGTLPAFTTSNYSLLPVWNVTEMGEDDETWSVNTTMFYAELTCEPANVTPDWNDLVSPCLNITSSSGDAKTRIGLVIDQDETGCQLDQSFNFVAPWTSIAERIGENHYMYAWASLQDPNWVQEDRPKLPINITAIYCYLSFKSQNVTADVIMPHGLIKQVIGTDNPIPFLQVNLNGVLQGSTRKIQPNAADRASHGELVAFGYQPRQLPDVDSQLQRRLGKGPPSMHPTRVSSNSTVFMRDVMMMSGLALFNQTEGNLGEMLNHETLAESYMIAHQLLFALLVADDIVSKNCSDIDQVTVVRHILARGFVVDRLWARGTQGGLAVITVITAVLACLIAKRDLKLDGEPNSLAEALRMLAVSPEVRANMQNSEFYSPKKIGEMFGAAGGNYKLELVGQGPRLQVECIRKHAILPEVDAAQRKTPWMQKLWALRPWSGIAFVFALGVVLGVLIVAFVLSEIHDGLPALAPINSFGYKFLFTYIPIGVGMAIEPVLIAIGTCQCMLAPYHALAPGPAYSYQSLTLDYDKSPPHFQIFNALRTGNIPLAVLASSILLSNVLAIAFAGLFSPGRSNFNETRLVHTYPQPVFQQGFTDFTLEKYYILSSSRVGPTSMEPPTWTTPEYYVLPVHPTTPDSVDKYYADTLGIGLDIQCAVIPQNQFASECLPNRTSPIELRTTDCPLWGDMRYSMVTVKNDRCWEFPSRADGSPGPQWEWSGTQLISYDTIAQSNRCPGRFYPMWLERVPSANPKGDGNIDLRENRTEGLILNCTAVDKVAKLRATIDSNMQLRRYTVIRELNSSEITALYLEKGNETLAATFLQGIQGSWEREGMSDSGHDIRWLNYLITTLDPSTVRTLRNVSHIPNETNIADGFEDVYRRLFAINLRLYAATIFGPRDPLPQLSSAKMNVIVDRVKIRLSMFIIAVTILVTMICVLVAIYWRQRQTIGHVPVSLAGMYALLYASNAQEECGEMVGNTPQRRATRLKKFGAQYMYGEHLDGMHHGVYRVVNKRKKMNSEGSEN